MSESADIGAYFERIGFAGSMAPSQETLEQLLLLHAAAIPFETLDPLTGVPVRLELRNLEQKLLIERRGGYCYEHNLLLKAMLEEIGFTVTGLAAWQVGPGGAPGERDHMVLLVEVGGVPHLVDLGHGSGTPTAPLKLRPDLEQATPIERFRLVGGEPEWRLDMEVGGEWRPVYGFDLTPQSFEDYVALNDKAQSTANFRDNVYAARAERGRRMLLKNTTLTTFVPGAEPERQTLGSVPAIRDALGGQFGIALPSAERLDPALQRVIEAN